MQHGFDSTELAAYCNRFMLRCNKLERSPQLKRSRQNLASMHAYYADQFVLPLPEGHRFPMAKYRMLRDRLAAHLPGVAMQVAPPEIGRAHV